jgi:hypothetical protein
VVSDNRKTSERVPISNRKGPAGHSHAYDGRKRFYSILLLFVVVVGLPLVGLPPLRHRLVTRVVALREAILGKSGPAMANMDEEQIPYPEEFEKPASGESGSGVSLPMDRIFTAKSADSGPLVITPNALITPKSAIDHTASSGTAPEEDTGESGSKDAIVYTQGEVEREMYDLVLGAYPRVAEMVKGDDPSLRFQSWGGAKRSEDTYWIRLIFKNKDDLEVEYIWQVDLQTNQVLPLSYNARNIS